MTCREALNAAMEEEMTKDPNVFIMGEEVGQYNGAYKVSQIPVAAPSGVRSNGSLGHYAQVTKGLLDKFGEKRVIDTPITVSKPHVQLPRFSILKFAVLLAGIRFHRYGGRSCFRWSAPHLRVHDLQLCE